MIRTQPQDNGIAGGARCEMQPTPTAQSGHPAPAMLADLASLDAALARDHAAHQRPERRRAARDQVCETLGYCREVIGQNLGIGGVARQRAIARIDAALAAVGEALL